MSEYHNIVQRVEEYVSEVLKERLSDDFVYHNLEHTQEVVNAAKEIGVASELSDEELEVVMLAAWFHDVGFINGCDDHETESIKIAREKLDSLDYPQSKIQKVTGCIDATRMPQNPKNMMERVLCDADLFHLSTDLFSERSHKLKIEKAHFQDEELSDEEWLKNTSDFVKKHQYFTPYGQTILEPKKKANLKKLNQNNDPEGAKKDSKNSKYVSKLEKEVVKLQSKLDQQKLKTPTRGIETMFRITSKNHLTLSGMADTKANIMISVNSIILSVLVSLLFRKLEDSPQLLLPGLILSLTSLIAIVFAILATRPNVSSGKFTKEEIHNKKTNLLFFGNFHSMDLDTYLWGMREMMKDGDYLYGSLIKDIYYLGSVLGTKYKMLRYSYTVFMFGFIISIIFFILASIYPNSFLF